MALRICSECSKKVNLKQFCSNCRAEMSEFWINKLTNWQNSQWLRAKKKTKNKYLCAKPFALMVKNK